MLQPVKRIIIDGNDGTGKTWLAERLLKDLHIKSYIHMSAKDPQNASFYKAILLKDNVLFDRSFLDEQIYSRVFHRKSELSTLDTLRLERIAFLLGYTVIICHRDLGRKQYHENDSKVIQAHEKQIDNYFETIALTHGYLYFDPLNGSYDSLLAQVKCSLVEAAHRQMCSLYGGQNVGIMADLQKELDKENHKR